MTTEEAGFDFRQWQEVFIVSATFRLTLMPTQTSMHCKQEALSTGQNGRVAKVTYPHFYPRLRINGPIPVATRSKAWVFGRSLAEIASSNAARSMDVCLLWVLCALM
jgi:hypothetical protein